MVAGRRYSMIEAGHPVNNQKTDGMDPKGEYLENEKSNYNSCGLAASDLAGLRGCLTLCGHSDIDTNQGCRDSGRIQIRKQSQWENLSPFRTDFF